MTARHEAGQGRHRRQNRGERRRGGKGRRRGGGRRVRPDPLRLLVSRCEAAERAGLRMTTGPWGWLGTRSGRYAPEFDPFDDYFGVPPEYHPLDLVLLEQPEGKGSPEAAAANILGVTRPWVEGFMVGLVQAAEHSSGWVREEIARTQKKKPNGEDWHAGYAAAAELIDRVYRPRWAGPERFFD